MSALLTRAVFPHPLLVTRGELGARQGEDRSKGSWGQFLQDSGLTLPTGSVQGRKYHFKGTDSFLDGMWEWYHKSFHTVFLV